MKTLQNHTLIYDNDCPMCNLYSKAFTKSGMLGEEGRKAFSEMTPENKNLIDFARSKNEIALVDQSSQTVFYGLDSLLVIIGNSFPTLEKIARFKPLYWFFQRLYKLVSYNRKQMVPSTKDYSENACVPEFNLKYRVAYIISVLLFSAYILSLYNAKMFPNFEYHFQLKFFICTMQIVWQTLFLGHFLKEKFWDYLGNMMTVSLIGTFLLIPLLYLNFSVPFYFIYFGFVVFIMVLEHIRRCGILQIGFIPTLSWILFRITFGLVLIYIVTKGFTF